MSRRALLRKLSEFGHWSYPDLAMAKFKTLPTKTLRRLVEILEAP